MNGRLVNERGNQGINKAGMNVGDIGIDVADNIAIELVDGFPEVFTFSPLEAMGREDFARVVEVDSVGPAYFRGAVGGPGVDDRKFIEQGVIVHQGVLEDDDFLPDSLLLVQGRDAEGDFQSGFLLGPTEGLKVSKFPVMKGIGF